MDSQNDEAELWLRACHDDGAAFAALFDRHHGRVYRRALGQLGNVNDAEDVATTAFFELWRKRRTVQLVAGSVLPWLLVTTVNLSRNARRSCPDLMGVQVINGQEAYIYSKEFGEFKGSGYINVYKCDGTTVIGKFGIGIVGGGSHR